MAILEWDKTGEREYETGVSKGVLFPQETGGTYGEGVAWSGLTGVTESPSGAEPTALYADNIKYLNILSNEEYAATIEAYMYPDEWAECNGEVEVAPGVTIGQQKRKGFGFTWQTIKGNDTDYEEHGYKIHILYNGLAQPSEKGYETVNDSPDAITFSWEVSTTPIKVTGGKPTASITIDSTKVKAETLKKLEDKLYGTASTAPELPLPDEIIEMLKES